MRNLDASRSSRIGRVHMRYALVGSIALAVTAAGAWLGAGTAAAADPLLDLDEGRIGVQLNHNETVALAGGPVPAVVSMVVPLNRMGAGLHPETRLWRDENGSVHASLRQVIAESARHPDGTVSIYLNAPGTRNGRVLDVYQNWTR
ncbi:hypothetical protein IU436_20200 [Nocardia farcinica]|nr:hypothetical protein [Nocardia farcinica]MBF6432680.1 hypothetical protein [Nocardia farcinica]MBF6503179.1 hypothetical protein [Nocardia farcinica]